MTTTTHDMTDESSNQTTAVVLLSGGIDSATCFALACSTHDRVIPVHVHYGQQTEDVEYEMASKQRTHIAEQHPDVAVAPMVELDYRGVFDAFAGGVAEGGKDFAHMTEEDGRSSGYVPMRNIHLIASAAAVADTRDADAVFHGAQAGDEADYPDCRPEFMDAAQTTLDRSVPNGQEITLETPLLTTSKVDVLRRADDLGVNFAHTYSCYSEVTDPTAPEPCGECPACVERAQAFDEAGVDKPFNTTIQVGAHSDD